MRVLITGASGQVGRALLATAPPDTDCIAITRNEMEMIESCSIYAAIDQHRPDVVINAAAYTAVDQAELEPELAYRINHLAVRDLCHAVMRVQGKLIQLSTDFVFDGAASQAYAPDADPKPLSVYGKSKAAGEACVGADALIVRTSWVYEIWGSNFVLSMLQLMRQRHEIGVVYDQIGGPTWAMKLAQTIWALVQRDARGIWHHSDAGAASRYDFAVAISEEAHALGLLDHPVVINPLSSAEYPARALRPRRTVLDCTATLAALETEPVHWRDNLKSMLKRKRALG